MRVALRLSGWPMLTMTCGAHFCFAMVTQMWLLVLLRILGTRSICYLDSAYVDSDDGDNVGDHDGDGDANDVDDLGVSWRRSFEATATEALCPP